MIQSIFCNDETCKYNRDGIVCEAKSIDHRVDTDSNGKAIVVCMNYEDKREQEDG